MGEGGLRYLTCPPTEGDGGGRVKVPYLSTNRGFISWATQGNPVYSE